MASMILIENLYPKVDVNELCKAFGKYGRILSADIEYDKNLVSVGKGYVYFADKPSAQRAVQEMNEVKKKLGSPIHVKIVKYEKENNFVSVSTAANYSETKIFVNNIDSNWHDCHLRREFKRFGEINYVKISESNGKSNGYGFVKFLKSSSAREAIKRLNGKVVNKRRLVVEPFIPWTLRERKRSSLDLAKVLGVEYNNLHVKNLHKNITENELKTLFERFGPILSVKIPLDENGQSRGFGFVCFQKEEDASKAREEMDHFSYKTKILEINFNQKKAERQKYLQAIRKDPKIRRFSGGTETE